jgi:hypothetical protein
MGFNQLIFINFKFQCGKAVALSVSHLVRIKGVNEATFLHVWHLARVIEAL